MGRIEDIYENRPPDELVGIDEEIAKRVVAYIEKEYAVKGYNILPSDSLLDYFAGQALPGLSIEPDELKPDPKLMWSPAERKKLTELRNLYWEVVAEDAYKIAKNMIKQREKIREEKTNGEERK